MQECNCIYDVCYGCHTTYLSIIKIGYKKILIKMFEDELLNYIDSIYFPPKKYLLTYSIIFICY
jgi:hypothetical protein